MDLTVPGIRPASHNFKTGSKGLSAVTREDLSQVKME